MTKASINTTRQIERNIRYSSVNGIYYVHFDAGLTEGFPTLAEARKFKKDVLAEKLRIKIDKAIAKLRAKQNKEIKDEAIETYPLNALRACRCEYASYDDYYEAFDLLSSRHKAVILEYYDERKTLAEIGKTHRVTRERARQMIAKALDTIWHFICVDKPIIERNRILEEELARIERWREKTYEEYKSTHVYDPLMEKAFGKEAVEQTTMYYVGMIESLNLLAETERKLKIAGIDTVSKLAQMSEHELRMIRGIGNVALKDIKTKLAARHLCSKGSK